MLKQIIKKVCRIKREDVDGTKILSVFGMCVSKKKFASSGYWESRYKSGGNSGAGSYGRLSLFKAEVINGFIAERQIRSVIEFGAGDGNQLSLFDIEKYIGFDVSESALRMLRNKYAADSSKQFLSVKDYVGQRATMAMSLDVIYHLVEDRIFETYMERLFRSAEKYVIIYASNFDGQTAPHVRHRRFTDWISLKQPSWKLIKQIANRYPFDAALPDESSHADFYIYGLEAIP